MLKLGWRMLQFWKPLPAGFWWVLGIPEDRDVAQRRVWKWRSVWLLVVVLLAGLSGTIRRTNHVTVYSHPPGKPESKEIIADFYESLGMSEGMAEKAFFSRRPGSDWEIVTESEEGLFISPALDNALALVFVLLVFATLTWGLTRWVWLSIWLLLTRRLGMASHVESIHTAACYLNAGLVLVFGGEAVFLAVLWLLSLMGVLRGMELTWVSYFNLIFGGIAWIAAIRSDCIRKVFRNKPLAIASVLLVAGPGVYVLMGFAAYVTEEMLR